MAAQSILRTKIVDKTSLLKVFHFRDAIEAVEEAFRFYGQKKVFMPPKIYVYFPLGDLRCMPAFIPELGVAAVKNVTVHPANRELPTVLAMITLIDAGTGFPLALLEGALITRLRTAAAAAVASKYLARPDSKVLGFIGTGIQAETHLEVLLEAFPATEKIWVTDLVAEKGNRFAAAMSEKFKKEVSFAADVADVSNRSDILTTLTPARGVLVTKEMVRPGTHINAMGADASGKQELAPELLLASRIVVDDWEQASHSGEINVAVRAGIITQNQIAADIGELVTGKKRGRETASDITVFDSTGLAIQDLVCSFRIYEKLKAHPELFAGLQEIHF